MQAAKIFIEPIRIVRAVRNPRNEGLEVCLGHHRSSKLFFLSKSKEKKKKEKRKLISFG